MFQMSLELTDSAVSKAIELREKMESPDNLVLSIGLKGGGCSGFMYELDFIAPPEDTSSYEVIEYDNLTVYCDRKSLIFLTGTKIDYEETLMSSGFTFNTPYASRSCGCGESVAFDSSLVKNND